MIQKLTGEFIAENCGSLKEVSPTSCRRDKSDHARQPHTYTFRPFLHGQFIMPVTNLAPFLKKLFR